MNWRCEEFDEMPLLCAFSHFGNTELVSLLILFGASISDTDSVLKRTALMSACMRGHREVCEVLMQAPGGSDSCLINSTDTMGMSAVEHAASKGFVDVVKLLVNSSKSHCIERALVVAAYNGHKHVRIHFN